MTVSTCTVALPLPTSDPYDYAVPTALLDRVTTGCRVLVPVRQRTMTGIVLSVGDEPQEGLKDVLLVPDPQPLLSQDLLELAPWMSRYYAAPLGLVLRTMLPTTLWGASRLEARLASARPPLHGTSGDVVRHLERSGGVATASALRRRLGRPVWDVLQRLQRANVVTLDVIPPSLGPATRTERILRLTVSLPTLLERERTFGRATRQRGLYEAVDALGGASPVPHITKELGFSPSVVRGLVDRGLAALEDVAKLRDPLADLPGEPPPQASDAQRRAVREIEALPQGAASLLFGVTGSGKTLVYLEAIRQEVDRGGGAIVLVPEIALTPQTIARVRGAFGDTVAVLHSALSDGERADAWRALADGRRRVAVGARSAVFAPIVGLAAIVVDEEHDASYKHSERPRYHARDVALRRARVTGARVVLGSATPSLETWSTRDKIHVLELPTRVNAQPLPPVELIDLRAAEQVKESGVIPWSVALDTAVDEGLGRGEQVLLLLNRRGYANFLQCYDCGVVQQCPACTVSLTVHRSPDRLRCHYCGHERSVPRTCPECGAATHRSRGVGTQRLERWIAERQPRARIARMDADTTSRKWSHQRILGAVAQREVDVLLGTQMISKGLDFPNVTVVGVVDADTGLHLPDFRAAERTFQLIAQVAGRAGRGPSGGRVLVQTRAPNHYALQCASRHEFPEFAARALEERISPPYPPHVGLVNVVVSGEVEADVADASAKVSDWLRGLVRERARGAVDVVGPAPAPLARIKRRWRWHVVLRAGDRGLLGRVLRYATAHAPYVGRGAIRVTFDRDPVSML